MEKSIPVSESVCAKNNSVVKKVKKKLNVLDFLLAQVFVCLLVSLVLVGIRMFGEPEAAAQAISRIFSIGQEIV